MGTLRYFVTIIQGGYTIAFFEQTMKIGNILKTACSGNGSDGVFAVFHEVDGILSCGVRKPQIFMK